MRYALRERLASERIDTDVWFRDLTGIGPRYTADAAERVLFATPDDALASPAAMHVLSSVEVIEVADDAPGRYESDQS